MNQIIRPIFISILILIVGTGFAQTAEETDKTVEAAHSEVFNAGKFVMEHVSDAFEWHIATFGETEISVPLPIILYSSDK